MNENELKHWGIKGMHWGIRRYQNEDGTLTEEGKQRYRTDKKFAKKYDEESAKRRKIANINKKNKGNIDYIIDEKDNVNNRHSTLLSTVGLAVSDEIGYRALAGNKRTKGVVNVGRIAVDVGITHLANKKCYEIQQEYSLKKYNDDGSKRVRKNSKEDKKLNRESKIKRNAVGLTAMAVKALSNVLITKLANTDFGDTFNRGARQPFDVNGKWASRPRRTFNYKIG